MLWNPLALEALLTSGNLATSTTNRAYEFLATVTSADLYDPTPPTPTTTPIQTCRRFIDSTPTSQNSPTQTPAAQKDPTQPSPAPTSGLNK